VAEEGDKKAGEEIPAWFKWRSAYSTAWEPAEVPLHQLGCCKAIPVCGAVNVLLLDVIESERSWIPVVPIPLRAGCQSLLFLGCPHHPWRQD